MTPQPTFWQRYWLPLLAGALVLSIAFLAGRGCQPEPMLATGERPLLTNKEIRQANARQQQRQDSIAQLEQQLARVAASRDSLGKLAAAYRAESRRLIKPLTNHEATPLTPAAAALVAGPLANYRPGTVRLDSGRAIR
jgi:hypothetical protein